MPAFPGIGTHERALAAGVRVHGATVHFVRPEMDTGPIIAQAVVPVHPDDDEELLAARILSAEHRLFPMAVRLYAEGLLTIDGNSVAIAGAAVTEIAVFNPAIAGNH